MKEIKLPSGEYVLGKCFEANRFKMHGRFVSCLNHSKWVTDIHLPPGNWQIIGKADSLSMIGNGEILVYLAENDYKLSTTLILKKIQSH